MADSDSPSMSPSKSASGSPSLSPSSSPSKSASGSPSSSPSASPSASPSPIPAGDVTYTIHNQVRIGKKRLVFASMNFGGTNNDLYPTGGVALTNAKLGLQNNPDSVVTLESGADALLYEWDRSANTIRIFTQARVELAGENTVLADTTLELQVIGW